METDPNPNPILNAMPKPGGVGFDLQSTLKSPFFWVAVGAGLMYWMQHCNDKKHREPKNVTPAS